ncbi:Aldo/keto reductase [Nadsonia fulvescens var. elongata DSM 6958]|uniref:Aldo/keto reductase n=1 Tax=Nadsonia fulvescens var. elongata DSM 6958 TaxID=857566 RepID=A0A1E3PH30_9ASCO|nr:Aldo/keto reductase [Nadsonia fulvescens var. elongata DSM 6958]
MALFAPKIKLNSGAWIPQIGLGVYDIPASQTSRVVKTGLEVGYRHIDTAVLYCNEKEVSKGIDDFLTSHPDVSRRDIFYTTKIWHSSHGYAAAKKAIQNCIQAAPDNHIDLLLIHSPIAPAPAAKHRIETWQAMQEAIKSGSVGSIGVSNYGIEHIQQLLDWPGLEIVPAVNQIELQPWLCRVEIMEFCKSKGIQVEAFASLTRGVSLDNPTLLSLAKKYNKSPAQILLRWSIQWGCIPLAKSVHKKRLESNLQLWDWKLTDEDIERLADRDAYEVNDWDPTSCA